MVAAPHELAASGEERLAAANDDHLAGDLGSKPPLTGTFFSLDEANPIPAATMVPITVPIPGTIVPAAPPRSGPAIVRVLSAQALGCFHRSAGLVSAGLVSAGLVSASLVSASLVSAGLVLAGLVLAGLVLSFMLLPSVFLEERLDVSSSAASARRCDEAAPSTADALQTPSQMRRAHRAVPAPRQQRAQRRQARG